MLIVIPDVLTCEQLTALQDLLPRLDYADGRSTAGWSARLVKHNEQASPDPALDMWCARIREQLLAHPVFQISAFPKAIIGPLVSRYGPGQAYGPHVDEPLMDGARVDLAFTLFLSPPHTYDGGELTIEGPAGSDAHKHEAGSLVLYPATTLHQVMPVSRGDRYAAVGWVRSLVRDPERRELLFDLETARRRLFAVLGKTTDHDLLSKTCVNLMRMWCED